MALGHGLKKLLTLLEKILGDRVCLSLANRDIDKLLKGMFKGEEVFLVLAC